MQYWKSKLTKVMDVLEGRGFYIILFLCILSIGISGYVLFFTDSADEGDEPGYLASLPSDMDVDLPSFEIPPMNEPIDEPDPQDSDEPSGQAVFQPVPAPDTEEPSQPAETTPPVHEPPATNSSVAPEPAPATVVRPVEGQVLHSFSGDVLEYSPTMGDWRVHGGTDFEVQPGEQVLAVMAGKVSAVWEDPLWGVSVRIDHGDGSQTVYTGLQDQPAVEEGSAVEAGDILGGTTGTSLFESAESARLHVEYFVDGVRSDLEAILP